jgi:hypothetical protein
LVSLPFFTTPPDTTLTNRANEGFAGSDLYIDAGLSFFTRKRDSLICQMPKRGDAFTGTRLDFRPLFGFRDYHEI